MTRFMSYHITICMQTHFKYAVTDHLCSCWVIVGGQDSHSLIPTVSATIVTRLTIVFSYNLFVIISHTYLLQKCIFFNVFWVKHVYNILRSSSQLGLDPSRQGVSPEPLASPGTLVLRTGSLCDHGLWQRRRKIMLSGAEVMPPVWCIVGGSWQPPQGMLWEWMSVLPLTLP